MPNILGNDPDFREPGPKPGPRPRFRLFEVLVVLGILGLLVALLLPATRSAGPAARRSQCVNNLKQISLALHNYEEAHKALPPSYSVDSTGRPLHSWRTLILPFLGEEELYRTIDLTKPWNDPVNATALGARPSIFNCPATIGSPNTTTYLAIIAPDGCFGGKEPRRLREITDGQASTLMVIEAAKNDAVPWMAPRDADERLLLGIGPDSQLDHPGGLNAAFVDGSVKFLRLRTKVPARVRRALISISGHDEVSADEW